MCVCVCVCVFIWLTMSSNKFLLNNPEQLFHIQYNYSNKRFDIQYDYLKDQIIF